MLKIQMFRGSGCKCPQKNFENLDPQIAGNTLKLSIPLLPRYFVSSYDPIRQTFLAPGGHQHTPLLQACNFVQKGE